MSFSTWAALRTAIKDAIADHVAGTPCVGSYQIADRMLKYRTFEELIGLLEKTYTLEALENSGTIATRVSYGRYRRLS